MTPAHIDVRTSIARSIDGTEIAYHSLGHGPGLVIVGGVLSAGSDYMALANVLSGTFQVHVMDEEGGQAAVLSGRITASTTNVLISLPCRPLRRRPQCLVTASAGS